MYIILPIDGTLCTCITIYPEVLVVFKFDSELGPKSSVINGGV